MVGRNTRREGNSISETTTNSDLNSYLMGLIELLLFVFLLLGFYNPVLHRCVLYLQVILFSVGL